MPASSISVASSNTGAGITVASAAGNLVPECWNFSCGDPGLGNIGYSGVCGNFIYSFDRGDIFFPAVGIPASTSSSRAPVGTTIVAATPNEPLSASAGTPSASLISAKSAAAGLVIGIVVKCWIALLYTTFWSFQ